VAPPVAASHVFAVFRIVCVNNLIVHCRYEVQEARVVHTIIYYIHRHPIVLLILNFLYKLYVMVYVTLPPPPHPCYNFNSIIQF